jgi:hypothetical protein
MIPTNERSLFFDLSTLLLFSLIKARVAHTCTQKFSRKL